MEKPKSLIAGVVVAAIVATGAYDATNLSKGEFDEMVPMVRAKDSKGMDYPDKTKDLSKANLRKVEEMFALSVLAGNGPTGTGEMSVDEVQALYFDTAVAMGLTPEEAIGGVNLYDFIRR